MRQLKPCPLCGEEIQAFRDKLSVQEFLISGMCQRCQDLTFGGEDDASF